MGTDLYHPGQPNMDDQRNETMRKTVAEAVRDIDNRTARTDIFFFGPPGQEYNGWIARTDRRLDDLDHPQTGRVTSSSITNPPTTVGIAEFLTLIICQDGSGNHTFAWPATVASHGTIAATASKCNVQRFIYDVAATKWWSLSAMETGQ